MAVVAVLFSEAFDYFREVSFADTFLDFGGEWQPLQEPVGFNMWELIFGTVNVTFWSLLIALPLGLAAAVFMSEYAQPRARRILKPALEVLAGIPTVVYAFFALLFITPDVLQPLLGNRIQFFNVLSASIVMAVMILPTIASVSEDAMASVPRQLREAAYGLGATKLEVAFRVVLPAALGGIMAAVLLAIARVVGETMIVAVVAGSVPTLSLSPLETVQTMTGFMLQVGLGDAARGTAEYQSLFAVGATLFLMTLIANIASHQIVRRFKEKYD